MKCFFILLLTILVIIQIINIGKPMNEKDRSQVILGRDLFNEQISPLRDDHAELKRIQDVMNRDINLFLNPPPEPPPPPTPVFEKIPYFHFDALGIFLDVLEHGWEEEREDETFNRIEAVIAKAASYGCSAVSFFSWLDDNKPEHINLKRKIPWEVTGILTKKCDFTKPNERYWHLYKRFLKILRRYELRAIPQAFMWKYTFYHFTNNRNGVEDFFDGAALKHQRWMAWRLLVEQERLGMTPMIKFVNEPNHRGRCEGAGGGHWIANWHRDMWFHVYKETPLRLEDLVIDVHASEFAAAQLVYHRGAHARCTKCGVYEWDNIEANDRKPLREQHSVSIIDDLEDEHKSLTVFVNNLHNWQVKYSEDGSRHGNIVPVPGMNWRLGDSNQVYAMLRRAWGACKESSMRKDFYWGIYPMECLSKKDGVFEDYYDTSEINWQRFEAARRAYNEIYKRR